MMYTLLSAATIPQQVPLEVGEMHRATLTPRCESRECLWKSVVKDALSYLQALEKQRTAKDALHLIDFAVNCYFLPPVL